MSCSSGPPAAASRPHTTVPPGAVQEAVPVPTDNPAGGGLPHQVRGGPGTAQSWQEMCSDLGGDSFDDLTEDGEVSSKNYFSGELW